MIGRLRGTLVECQPDRVLVDVSGAGYEVGIPLSSYYPLAHASGRDVTLHIHTHVREDALVLFGFVTPGEREVFRRLLTISGVGPKMALAVLSGIEAEALEQAVLDGDRDRLQSIPGVGKKTAERILLELRDALSALVNLGYSRDRARRAVDQARDDLGDEADLEGLLKGALRRLA